MNTKPNGSRRLGVLALSMLAVLLMLIGLFATPWGQAFAQSVFRYFSVVPGDSFPLPPAQITLAASTPTIPPTFAAQLRAVEPIETEALASPTVEADSNQPEIAGCEEALASLTHRCQVSRAEATLGFAVKEPPGDIPGLAFSKASANQTLQLFQLTYTALSGGSELTIIQSRGGLSQSSWGEVPPSAAIERVKVGEFDGEYVRGMFIVRPGATSATWEPTAPVRRLRWQEGDMLFEIRLDGHTASVEYLEKDTLIELAESLTYTPKATEGQLRAEHLTSVPDAEKLAGFDLKEPAVLPEGFSFSHADFDEETRVVRTVYEYGGAGLASLVIFQTPTTGATPLDLAQHYPPGAVETVQISGVIGQYVAGSNGIVFDGTPVSGAPTPTTVWRPDDPQRTVVWSVDGLQIQLYFFSSHSYGGRLEKADLLALAESMK